MNSKMYMNKVYKQVFNKNERFIVLYGGAGSGKSKFAVQYMIIKYLKEKRKALIIRKVGATIKTSIFQEYITCISELGLYNKVKINKSDLTITLPNESMFIFKGLDDREKIKSISGIDDIQIEEASEVTKEDFEQLNLRLRSRKENQQIILMFNPIAKSNWTYSYFFGLDPPEDAFILKTTYLDNRFLPDKYIQELERYRISNPYYYKVYALGEYGSLGKQVLTNYRVKHNLKEEIVGKYKTFVGIDFGFTNDPTAAVLVAYDAANKDLYILDEIYKTEMVTDDIAAAIRSKDFDKYQIIADSAEPRLIKELKQKQLKIKAAKKGADSILHGLTWLQGVNIIVDSRCKNVLTELENYTWQKDKSTDEYINKPIDEFNHAIDALRYACEQFNVRNTLRTLHKSALGL